MRQNRSEAFFERKFENGGFQLTNIEISRPAGSGPEQRQQPFGPMSIVDWM
jgi:hypothetical protein